MARFMERFAGGGKIGHVWMQKSRKSYVKQEKKQKTFIIDRISLQMLFSVQSDQKSTNGNGNATARLLSA